MKIKKIVQYCAVQSSKKWDTAETLFRTKRYADCLFFCHLALEFKLKEKVVLATGQPFPLVHDLEDLASRSNIHLTALQRYQLAVINTFNIAGRYDDYKLSFYKKAKPAFTKKYFRLCRNLLLWLEKQ